MSDLVSTTATYIAKTIFDEGLSAIARRLMASRAEAAKQILLEELQRGEKFIEEVGEEDEVAAMVLRYARAAQEGAARLNLRLIAQVLAGTVHQRPIYADEFLRWADLLATLRREEIILASTLFRHWQAALKNTKDSARALEDAHKATKAELMGPSLLFADADAYDWNMTALTRTGLVRVWSTFGSISYVPSGLMDTFMRLTRIEAALKESRG